MKFNNKVIYKDDVSPLETGYIGYYNEQNDFVFLMIRKAHSLYDSFSYIVSNEDLIISLDTWVHLEELSNFTGINYDDLDMSDLYNQCSFSADVYSYYGSQASDYLDMEEDEFIEYLISLKIIE
jgi:hypothetical protein